MLTLLVFNFLYLTITYIFYCLCFVIMTALFWLFVQLNLNEFYPVTNYYVTFSCLFVIYFGVKFEEEGVD